MARRITVDVSDLADEIEDTTQEGLTEIANELVNQLKLEAPTGATGDLQRLTQIWQEKPGRIVITMPEHGRFVQEETSPPSGNKKIPFEPIERWARRKLNDEDAAGPVWQKLMNEGTDADPFIDRAIDETMQRFR